VVVLCVSDTVGVHMGPDDRNDPSDPFIEFYRSEYPRAVRLAYTLVGTVESAEDVVQELFSRLSARFLDLDNPAAYLRVGIIHECQDIWQQRRIATETTFPARQQMEASSSAELFDVLLKLPHRQRAVLVLRYWADWSEAEIAEALGCRPGAVKSLASRGLARLRKDIAP
jgi:RNA polymerase sigma factor (sigma-70 family)